MYRKRRFARQSLASGFRALLATIGLILVRIFCGLVPWVQHTDSTDRPSLSETPQLFYEADRDYVWGLEHISHFHLQWQELSGCCLLRKRGPLLSDLCRVQLSILRLKPVLIWLQALGFWNVLEDPKPTTGPCCFSFSQYDLKKNIQRVTVFEFGRRISPDAEKRCKGFTRKQNSHLMSYIWAAAVMSCSNSLDDVFRQLSLGDKNRKYIGEWNQRR